MKKVFITFVLKFLAFLPFQINRWLGKVLGSGIYYVNGRSVKVTKKNIQLCFPQYSEKEHIKLAKESCKHTGMFFTEAVWIWQRPLHHTLDKIVDVKGKHLIENALESSGVVLVGLHIGNWELMTLWLGQNFEAVCIYRKLKKASMDKMVKDAREKSGARLLEGNRQSIRQIFNALENNQVFAVLSDQEPDKSSGVFAPFFGHSAYTMTLPHSLLQKTNSQILFFSINRIKEGFALTIEPSNFDTSEKDKTIFASCLNQQLETIILRHPQQYEWAYKRFKTRPKGEKTWYRC